MPDIHESATEKSQVKAALMLACIGVALALFIAGYIGWQLHKHLTTPASSVTATVCARGYVGANGANEPLGDQHTGPQAVIQTTRGEYAIYAGWMADMKEGKTYRFTYTHDTKHDSNWISSVPVQVAQGAACK